MLFSIYFTLFLGLTLLFFLYNLKYLRFLALLISRQAKEQYKRQAKREEDRQLVQYAELAGEFKPRLIAPILAQLQAELKAKREAEELDKRELEELAEEQRIWEAEEQYKKTNSKTKRRFKIKA